jgi:vancomycin resistance protein VanJ
MPPDTPTRYTLRCDSRRHRVVLQPARYWKRTKCPVCMQEVDASRFRRAKKWLEGLAPRSGVRVGDRFRIVPIDGMLLLWGAVILTLTLVLHSVADRWWPATVLLFLGRWPWLLPAAPLLLFALLLKRRTTFLAAAVVTAVGLFGIMQLSIGTGRLRAPTYPESRVRIISYNIDGDAPAPLQLAELVTEWEPDVLAVQECGETSRVMLASLPGYKSDIGVTCLLTKFDITSVDSMRRDAFRDAGGAAWVKRYRLKGRVGEFDFTNLHLDIPRKAFDVLIAGDTNATTAIGDKTAVREVESRLARRWADLGKGPSLVAGDFNMPVESAIFREHWSSMQDGWEKAGVGFGYTRLAGWIKLRIDHILADEHWSVQSARLLPDYGSDHLPVMVEVDLKPK